MTLPGRFRKATDGLAAVEFALLLPVMITILFGLVETSLALVCRTDVVNVSSAVADLVAQEANVTSSDMTNVFSAANAILYPNDPSVAQITVTSVIYNTATNSLTSGKVAWSCTSGGTKRNTGSIVTLPANLMTANGSVIISEITYNYASPTTQMVIGPIAMANTFYSKPRRVAQIAGPAC
jgi:Flp pilus assembly protein TadG